jgi:hypothetical protein
MIAIKITAGDRAEQAGTTIALDCLDPMLNADSQGVRITILQNAMLELGRLKHQQRAVGGFVSCMVPVIELGLANLPQAEE